ncbi:MAG: hypothetical protein AMJ95_07185 [Omnitrophica WOR_2 bacterium SM23_72]|nr:MAG: hypothetical protein AMJ95_07185 [Omnitrophica WOR_2 bacterium SM23_72]
MKAILCVVPIGQIPKESGQFEHGTPLLHTKANSLNVNKANCVKPRAGIVHRLIINIVALKKAKAKKIHKSKLWDMLKSIFIKR